MKVYRIYVSTIKENNGYFWIIAETYAFAVEKIVSIRKEYDSGFDETLIDDVALMGRAYIDYRSPEKN